MKRNPRAVQGIDLVIEEGKLARDGVQATEPSIPVTLHVGGQVHILRRLAAPEHIGSVTEAHYVEIIEEARKAVAHEAASIESELGAMDLMVWRDELLEAVRTTPEDGDPIGPMFRIVRRHQGISQREVADATGRDRHTIASWEAGRSAAYIRLGKAASLTGYPAGAFIIASVWLENDAASA